MVRLKTIKAFYDLHEHVDHRPGDVFEATEERADHIMAALPGYVEVVKEVDYTKMTLQELTALAKERGVMPKGRASKAALIAALTEE